MNSGRKWIFLAPITAIGLGIVVTSGIPTLRGGEGSPYVRANQRSGYRPHSEPAASGASLRRATPQETIRLRPAEPTKLPFVEKANADSSFPKGIVLSGAEFPEGERKSGELQPNHIPARGPDAGKTVNPEQPIPPYRKSVGAQDASLTVDWVTPETIVLMKQGRFDLVLRNRGRIAIEEISITNVLPKGFRFVKSDPLPTKKLPKMVWLIKKLEPQEEARISLYLVPTAVGNAMSAARVDFHAAAASMFKVVQPKLKIEAEGPKTVLVGNQAVFNVVVKNPGSGKTTNCRMKAFLPKELEPVAAGTEYDIGTLNPGESRTIRVLARVNKLGTHKVKFITIADDKLRDEVLKEVVGLQAKLDIAITGPKFRYLARPAKYKLRVKNTGNAVARNVTVSVRVPRAFAYLSGGKTGRFDASTKTVNWYIGTLAIGKESTAEFSLKAVNRGNFPLMAEATADRDIKSQDKHVTRVDGIAAILLEVVDVDDPVEVGAVTYYEILVTNQGTEFAKNIKIQAKVPKGITILGAKGPSEGKIIGDTITFDALTKLAPRADAIYRVKVMTTKAGDQRIEVTATADSLDSPVKELESTKVYEDRK